MLSSLELLNELQILNNFPVVVNTVDPVVPALCQCSLLLLDKLQLGLQLTLVEDNGDG